jgi:hypothetical protein
MVPFVRGYTYPLKPLGFNTQTAESYGLWIMNMGVNTQFANAAISLQGQMQFKGKP